MVINKNNNNVFKASFPYIILLLVVLGTLLFFNFAGSEVHELTTGELRPK